MTRASSDDDIIISATIIQMHKLGKRWALGIRAVGCGFERRWAEATTLTVKPVWPFAL